MLKDWKLPKYLLKDLQVDLQMCLQLLLQPHPQPHFSRLWQWLQAGLVLMPFSPVLGGVCALISMLGTTFGCGPQLRQRPLNWLLLGLSVWLLCGVLFAAHPVDALLGLANFIPFFWLFATASELIQTESQRQHIVWLLVLTSLGVSSIGLGQMFGWWSGPINILGVVNWPLTAGGDPPGRMSSVFGYANVLASYLILVLPLAIGLWLQLGQQLRALRQTTQQQIATTEQLRGLRNASRQQHRQLWQQWGLVSLAIVLAAIALLLTSSRNGCVMGFLVLVSFVIQQRWYLCLAAIAGAVFSCLWAAFGTFGQGWFRQWVPSLIWARLNDQRYPNRPVEDLRITQWKFAWSMTQDRPWFGWGLQGFNRQYELQTGFWLGHPHNLFLMLSAETGLLATLLLIGLVGFLLVKTAQNAWQYWLRKQANLTFAYWLAFIICSLSSILDVTLFDARVNMLNWLVLAVIAGYVYASQAESMEAQVKSHELQQ